MRLRSTRTPLLALLLALCCAALTTDNVDLATSLLLVQTNAQESALASASTASTSMSTLRQARTDVGTKDAPVDGLDGKPHSGPFVDGTTEPAKGKDSTVGATKKADTALVEDGVMNDRNRQLPKKGTTGVEGGVSEKERDKSASSSKALKKPDSPKEPIPAPHDRVTASENVEAAGKKSVVEKLSGLDGERPRGAPGIGVCCLCVQIPSD